MSLINGFKVTGVITPVDTNDNYAVIDPVYGVDGLRNVADHTTRNSIPFDRRRAGMVVGTLNDGLYWQLLNQTWTYTDSDWTPFGVAPIQVSQNYLMGYNTSGNSSLVGFTMPSTPISNSYVNVFVNGLQYQVGDGVTSSVPCYFSADGGITARGFEFNNIQVGDSLYWNGTFNGFNLYSGWNILITYLV